MAFASQLVGDSGGNEDHFPFAVFAVPSWLGIELEQSGRVRIPCKGVGLADTDSSSDLVVFFSLTDDDLGVINREDNPLGGPLEPLEKEGVLGKIFQTI